MTFLGDQATPAGSGWPLLALSFTFSFLARAVSVLPEPTAGRTEFRGAPKTTMTSPYLNKGHDRRCVSNLTHTRPINQLS